jgi:hypothetical protein
MIYLGDCLDVMGSIPDGSIDLVLCDLPYGVTALRWDQVIPFEPLWAHYKRLLKPRAAVVLTASQPFTSMLVMSNPEWFRHSWVWMKTKASGHLNCRRMPLRCHEDVLVFGRSGVTYNPQGMIRGKFTTSRPAMGKIRQTPYRQGREYGISEEANFPKSVLTFPNPSGSGHLHPTQKPVPLFEYFIETYSNEGDTVLDNAMGSGTTGLACLNTGRHFIGIESDPAYFAIAERRLAAASNQTPLFAG